MNSVLPRIPNATLVGAMVCALLLVLGGDDTRASHEPGQPRFDPTVNLKLCNDLPSNFGGPNELKGQGGSCTENPAQGASPDITVDLDLSAGDLQFSPDTLVLMLSDGFDIGDDAAIPDGTVVGGIHAQASVAYFAGTCNNPITSEFILYDATTDVANEIFVAPGGLGILASDGNDPYDEKADADSPVVTQYPSFANEFFDPDGPGGDPPVVPHSRYAGLTQISGEWQLVQIVNFPPGALKASFSDNPYNPTHPFSRLDSSLGWTSIVILNNPLVSPAAPSSNTEFCTPFGMIGTLLGYPGSARLTSPSTIGGIDGEGTHPAKLYTLSRRDLDADGIDNSLDSCPHVSNIEDPFVANGPDTDGLDSSCDPTPTINTNGGDHDGDGFLNTEDNCPLDSNTTQFESENPQIRLESAPDGGPWNDYLGDACDSEYDTENSDIEADGRFFHALLTDAFCINNTAGADADGDGWCHITAGADPNDANNSVTGEPNQNVDGHLFGAQPGHGHFDYRETWMQTDPLADCPEVVGEHDAWPPDFTKNRQVNIGDNIAGFGQGQMLTEEGDPNYQRRSDGNADGFINVGDVIALHGGGVMLTSCTPP